MLSGIVENKGRKADKKINSFLERKMGMTYSAQKPRDRFGAPRGKTTPQYKGTKALSDYPFGKRLILNLDFQPRNQTKSNNLNI